MGILRRSHDGLENLRFRKRRWKRFDEGEDEVEAEKATENDEDKLRKQTRGKALGTIRVPQLSSVPGREEAVRVKVCGGARETD